MLFYHMNYIEKTGTPIVWRTQIVVLYIKVDINECCKHRQSEI